MRKFKFKTQEELGDSYYNFFPKALYNKMGTNFHGTFQEAYDQGEIVLIVNTKSDSNIFPFIFPAIYHSSTGRDWYIHNYAIQWEWTDEELLQEAKKSSSKFKNFIKELTHEEI